MCPIQRMTAGPQRDSPGRIHSDCVLCYPEAVSQASETFLFCMKDLLVCCRKMLQPCHKRWQEKYLQAGLKARSQFYSQDISPSASPSPSHTHYSYGKGSDTDQVRRQSLGSNPMATPVKLKITRWDGKEPLTYRALSEAWQGWAVQSVWEEGSCCDTTDLMG